MAPASVRSIPSGDTRARVRRNRWFIVLGLAVIAMLMAGLFAYMRQVAAVRAQQHQHSFYEYVVTHHLGQLTDIDSGTGIDPVAYVLTVEHPIPDADKATFTYQLSHLYAEYDHGQSLTIVYVNPQTHRQVPIAEAQYDDDNHRLTLTLTLDNGQTVTQTQTVDW